jgi:hypothetical protein
MPLENCGRINLNESGASWNYCDHRDVFRLFRPCILEYDWIRERLPRSHVERKPAREYRYVSSVRTCLPCCFSLVQPRLDCGPVQHDKILAQTEQSVGAVNLAHLSIDAVRRFYETAHRDCQMLYDRLPTPKQMQTLVQVWKQLWKWR